MFEIQDPPEETRLTGRVGGLPPGATYLGVRESCVGCGDCVEVCPSDLLRLDADGLPRFAEALGCGLCGLCADVCAQGAIPLTPATRRGLDRTMRLEREAEATLRAL
ncbi:4Fe-4S dicluster domain-containing protein [Roseovarius aestuariivivens]|uniref:4Fe-4S dicluster domain-containing protein n=1 Tax=Roseovarius aestuariivivens TaxID=1888910 RepID=UPI001080D44C|nr:4Fe-4S dicluster domain-containing protein [Roseovarius aestuariivivens]